MIVNLLAKIGDFLPLPINSEKVQKLIENYEVSNDKIKKAMNKELPLSLKKGAKVLFTKYAPHEITVDEKEYLVIKEEDILAVIE